MVNDRHSERDRNRPFPSDANPSDQLDGSRSARTTVEFVQVKYGVVRRRHHANHQQVVPGSPPGSSGKVATQGLQLMSLSPCLLGGIVIAAGDDLDVIAFDPVHQPVLPIDAP